MDEWLSYELNLKKSSDECMKTPVYVRRYRLERLKQIKSGELSDDDNNSNVKTVRTGKNTVKRTITGKSLVDKIKSNEIDFNND